MKKWSIMMLLFLSSCHDLGMDALERADQTETSQPVDAYDEVAPHFEEIETLLAHAELEAGLGNLTTASSFFRELMVLVHGHEVTTHQQARINTLSELLRDIVVTDEERLFSGSDAAAKVMNIMGVAPEGYVFVYHEIPSFVGSEELGYYVFLVPTGHDATHTTEIRKTFFVTERGEILTLE